MRIYVSATVRDLRECRAVGHATLRTLRQDDVTMVATAVSRALTDAGDPARGVPQLDPAVLARYVERLRTQYGRLDLDAPAEGDGQLRIRLQAVFVEQRASGRTRRPWTCPASCSAGARAGADPRVGAAGGVRPGGVAGGAGVGPPTTDDDRHSGPENRAPDGSWARTDDHAYSTRPDPSHDRRLGPRAAPPHGSRAKRIIGRPHRGRPRSLRRQQPPDG